jgi:hypothetical protein
MDHTVKGTRYEYIQITVSNTMKPLYIFYYENSGWIFLEEASEVKERTPNVTLNFRRDLINNKNREEEANPNCWSRL